MLEVNHETNELTLKGYATPKEIYFSEKEKTECLHGGSY